jgi:hypothetical protein
MSPSSAHRLARLVTAGLAALVVVAGFGSSASAGGWAVGSIDEIPDAAPGQTADVGFTILQHGVTPAELTDDVGVEIVLADGTVQFFAATSAGAAGHYVAAVTFPPAPGEYSWNLRMGWFGVHDLGTLDVTPADRGVDTAGWYRSTTRWVTLGLAAVLASVAVTDLMRTRRHARATPT